MLSRAASLTGDDMFASEYIQQYLFVSVQGILQAVMTHDYNSSRRELLVRTASTQIRQHYEGRERLLSCSFAARHGCAASVTVCEHIPSGWLDACTNEWLDASCLGAGLAERGRQRRAAQGDV